MACSLRCLTRARYGWAWIALPVLMILSACGGSGSGSSSTVSLAPPTVGPTPTPEPRTEELHVKTLTSSSLSFDKGDYVWIIAQGEIRMGPFVGYLDPDGSDSWLLSGYNIVPNAPHGGLLCRLKGQTDWSFCGSDTEFQPEEPGQLEFQINDRDQGNNDPGDYFQVGIVVASYSVRAEYVKSAKQQQIETQSQSAETDSYSPSNIEANVPPPNDSQDCTNPSVSSAWATECSVIIDRENWERDMAEREAEYQRQQEEQRQKAEEQRQNIP